ncbi:MAG: NAD(P)/FAD-dependent oxidoreductase, partial [Chloroflexota bacterium]
MTRYIIVGTGAAGVAAASAIRTHDASGEILLIGEESAGYYSRPALAYYLANEIPEEMLYPFTKQDFKDLKLTRLHDQVIKIDPAAHQIHTRRGKTISYDKLLIAVGATAVRPKMPGADLEGVIKLDNLRDTRKIIQRARRAKTAVVVGGGITALEIVEGLLARKIKVHYFLRKDRYWGNVLDSTESKIVEMRLINEGVRIHYHTEL